MILTIDIGNSNLKWALFKDKTSPNLSRPLYFAQIPTQSQFSPLLWQNIRQNIPEPNITDQIKKIGFCSVVPPLKQAVQEFSQTYLGKAAREFTKENMGPVTMACTQPHQVGTDRLLNAYSAAQFYPLPSIVVDLGTANTYTYLDRDQKFTGGVIAPGYDIMARALAEFTEQLPQVKFAPTPPLSGSNTNRAIQSGLWQSLIGQIKQVVAAYLEQKPSDSVKLIFTGQLAQEVLGHSNLKAQYPDIIFDGFLKMKGLAVWAA
jgi:type III pantothenate kinase